MAPPVLRSFDSHSTLATENLNIIFAQKQPYFNDTFLHYHIFILPSRKKVRFAHKIAPRKGALRGSGGCGQHPGFHPCNAQKGAASKGFGGILSRKHHAVLYCIRGASRRGFFKRIYTGGRLYFSSSGVKSRVMERTLVRRRMYLTPAASSIRLEARVEGVVAYLSDK